MEVPEEFSLSDVDGELLVEQLKATFVGCGYATVTVERMFK